MKSGCVLWVLGWWWEGCCCSFGIQICYSDFHQPSSEYGASLTRDTGSVAFFYFLSHITSFVLLIVSWWETQKVPLQWQLRDGLNKSPWRRRRKQSLQSGKKSPRQGDSRKDGPKGNLLMISFFFFKMKQNRSPFRKQKLDHGLNASRNFLIWRKPKLFSKYSWEPRNHMVVGETLSLLLPSVSCEAPF